ncbi:hypothetical protein U91I_02489 [alpha proteobacterium U9-1i]|nr:hypothetical protein U91I_02489 [alpha proteobacterium U9-1i]
MVEKSGSVPSGLASGGADLADLHRALAAALKAAGAVMSHQEVEDAERSAKVISALARAARDVNEVGELARAGAPQEDNVEELRAELRRRLALYAEADRTGAPLEVLERIAMEGRP